MARGQLIGQLATTFPTDGWNRLAVLVVLDPPVPPSWEFGLDADWVLAAPADGQILYRVLGRSVPRLRDFQSDREKERPCFPDQPYVDYVGLSMFESESSAEENAANFPKHIASVQLAAGKGFSLARTEIEIEGHFAVWGDPEALLDSVDGPVSRYDEPE